MHKNAIKCNETLSKWCKNKHGASKIMDTLEMYQGCTRGRDRTARGRRARAGLMPGEEEEADLWARVVSEREKWRSVPVRLGGRLGRGPDFELGWFGSPGLFLLFFIFFSLFYFLISDLFQSFCFKLIQTSFWILLIFTAMFWTINKTSFQNKI
jgi:hypothetical protein